MGWILRLKIFYTMLYIAVTVVMRKIHISKKIAKFALWVIYVMIVDVASLQ